MIFVSTWYVFYLLLNTDIKEYGIFFIIGLIGAMVASATGAGGGIFFIPAFSAMDLSFQQALATSFIIQCFGMTSGSISWLNSIKSANSACSLNKNDCHTLITKVILLAAPASILGALFGQYYFDRMDISYEKLFSLFSIAFAFILFATSKKQSKPTYKIHLHSREQFIIILASLLGGLITSLISIGIGEVIAFILILIGIDTMISIAIAVCLSSITVIVCAVNHIIFPGNIIWDIVIFAGPAAIIGGYVARLIAARLGARKLKMFYSIWILFTGVTMLAL